MRTVLTRAELKAIGIISDSVVQFGQLKHLAFDSKYNLFEWLNSIHYITRLGLLKYGQASKDVFEAHENLTNNQLHNWKTNEQTA